MLTGVAALEVELAVPLPDDEVAAPPPTRAVTECDAVVLVICEFELVEEVEVAVCADVLRMPLMSSSEETVL